MARRAGQPSVRSRRLAMVLRKLRESAGLSGTEAAKAVGMSTSKISRVETTESGIYLDDIEKLLDLYQVTGSRRVELLDLARHAEERGWLRMSDDDTFSENWQTWADLESDATTVLDYEPLMIPGLLQTTEYAKAIIQSTGINLSDADVDKLVTSRMSRQVRLNHAHPIKLHAIIEESVLARPFGDINLWARQVRHLVDLTTHPNVTIQVLPIQAGLHSALYGSFVILEYADNTKLVNLEGAISNLFLDEPEQVEVYAQSWAKLQELACGAEESAQLISAIATQAHKKT